MKSFFASCLIALLVFSGQAQAEQRLFRFTGQVTYAMGIAPVGAKIEGQFSYNTSARPNSVLGETSGPGVGSATYIVPALITATVDGRTISASTTIVEVVNNFGGNVEDSISVYGAPANLDRALYPEGSFGLYLASAARRDRVLKDVSLPHRINVRRFDGMNYGWLNADGSSTGTLLSFTIDRVKARDGDESDDD